MAYDGSAQRQSLRDVGFASANIVLGWLVSKAWSDPGCQLGLVIFRS